MNPDDNPMEQDPDRKEDNDADDDDDDDDGGANGVGDDDHDGGNENGDVRPTDNEEEEDEENHEDGDNDIGDDDYCSFTEGEEDLEATVQTINERLKRPQTDSSGTGTSASEPRITADEFVRNFLSQMRMTETLNTFQTEWTVMVQKGLLHTKRFGEVPEVHIQNQRLHNELKNALRERKEYQLAASTSAETLARVQKARDAEFMKRKRASQENNRLLEDTRRLKSQCHTYESALRRMDDKLQVLVEQTMRAALGRDKVLNLAQSQPCPPTVPRDKEQKTNSCMRSSHRLRQVT
ncbi:sperm-associated antigen 16 protein-like [Syngnathus acus]|uniref:sperm-associated antigen 16 protein-like n=1 Tax=Syngnathus acus TaxID=161584 RepID=UPI0018864AC7|nr:sperm-associated antigen 16 protein-like [Syngnathus acus]